MKLSTLTAQIPRIVLSIAIGVLLLFFPEFFQNFIMIILGGLIALVGVIQLIAYFMPQNANQARQKVPFGAIITLILGVIIILKANLFTEILIFSLGFILMIGGLGQVMMFLSLRHTSRVPAQMYIAPLVVVIAGLLALLNPFGSIVVLLMFFGGTLIFYGLFELVSIYVIKRTLETEGKSEDIDTPLD